MRGLAGGLVAALLWAPVAGSAQRVAPSAAPEPVTTSRLVNGDKGVVVVRGQRVVLRVAGDGALTLVSVSSLDPASLSVPMPQGPGKAPPEMAQAMKNGADSGTVTLALGGTPQSGSLLKFENGLDRHIAYRANIVRVSGDKASASATSVCSVLPHIVSWERWPEPVIVVVASAFADQAGAPVCR